MADPVHLGDHREGMFDRRGTDVDAEAVLGADELAARYQQLLARCFTAYGLVIAIFSGLLAGLALVLRGLLPILLSTPSLIQLARVPLLVLAVVVLRARPLAPRALAAVELGVTGAVIALSSAPIALEPAARRPELDGIISLFLLLMLRAGLLQPSKRWTLVVSCVAAAPLVAAAVIRAVHLPAVVDGMPTWTAIPATVVWSVTGIAISTFVAATVARLRGAVADALKLGPYTLEEKIGEGGMGAVYRARHAMLRRPAAIKILPPDRTSENDLARFEREAQLTSQLTHPNTVSIFDYGRTAHRGFYYVMEYLDGYNLHQLVKEHGPLPPGRAVHILVQVCGALAEAHQLGLVHRDIKPDNIILTTRVDEPDVAKLVDFGLVRSASEDSAVTLGRAIVGTPGYMAPETLRGGEVDARSDLYAVGAVAYFLLTGRSVFPGKALVDVARRHIFEEPPSPSRIATTVPPQLDAIVLRCLAKAPAERYPSAVALRDDLLACAALVPFDPTEARRWWESHARPGATRAEPPATEETSLAIDLQHRVESAPTRPDRPRSVG